MLLQNEVLATKRPLKRFFPYENLGVHEKYHEFLSCGEAVPFEYANVGAIISMPKIPYLPTLTMQDMLSLQQSGNVSPVKWTTGNQKGKLLKNDKLSTITFFSPSNTYLVFIGR